MISLDLTVRQTDTTYALTSALSPAAPVVCVHNLWPASASWWRFLSTRGSSQPLSMSAVNCSACWSRSPKLDDISKEGITKLCCFLLKLTLVDEKYPQKREISMYNFRKTRYLVSLLLHVPQLEGRMTKFLTLDAKNLGSNHFFRKKRDTKWKNEWRDGKNTLTDSLYE